jgi:predicted transcriptional regulator
MDMKGIAKMVTPRGKAKIDSHASYGLSELGKVHVEDYLGEDGSVMLNVMAYLDEHGASRIRTIAKDLDMHEDEVKEVLRKLLSQGYVRMVTS